MDGRYRGYKTIDPDDIHRTKLNSATKDVLRAKHSYLEFKFIYFQIQALINRDVVLSFKYEQLKMPEVKTSLIRPLAARILEISKRSTIDKRALHHGDTSNNLRPHDSASRKHTTYEILKPDLLSQGLTTNVIYVLLLLRYEYMIQSESHLIMYDMLTTKANVCELLSIRLLRNYTSAERVSLLFINPMSHHDDEYEQLKNTKHLDTFNTLELAILSKSKRLLSQPVIVAILDRIYNGELSVTNCHRGNTHSKETLLDNSKHRLHPSRENSPGLEAGLMCSSENSSLAGDCEDTVVNYRYNRITLSSVYRRSNVVPKYQSVVINVKYGFLTILFFLLVLQHRKHLATGDYILNTALSLSFWLTAFSFNMDLLVRLLHIEYRFLKKIIWTYVDMLIVMLLDISFVLRILLGINRIESLPYYNIFSLISVLLFPRMLSVFNNYEFFNMIVVSLKKMTWNVIAMFCLFISLIFGFFLCFISLTSDMSTYDVGFAMLKVFFGFTPAVWDNWKHYDNLGRTVQLMFLALMQFVMTTILAIVLSNVFAKVNETNKEEFEYLKATNLVIYLKRGQFHESQLKRNKLVVLFDFVAHIFMLPIIAMIYAYEMVIQSQKRLLQQQHKELKHFQFLNRDDDLYGDDDMSIFGDADNDVTSLRLMSREATQVDPRVLSMASQAQEDIFKDDYNLNRRFRKPALVPKHSESTMLGFRAGLLDSMYIDDYLGKKYGFDKVRRGSVRPHPQRVQSGGEAPQNAEILERLQGIEEMLALILAKNTAHELEDDYTVRQLDDDALLIRTKSYSGAESGFLDDE